MLFTLHRYTCVSPEECSQVFLSLRLNDPDLRSFTERKSSSKHGVYEIPCCGTRNIAPPRGFSSYAGALCAQHGEEKWLLFLEGKACSPGGHVWETEKPGVRSVKHVVHSRGGTVCIHEE